MAQTIDQIIASRKALYDPQRALIAQQQSALAPEEQTASQGLETAKTNAFGDITNQANARGMVYSGAPIQEQQRYVGERYLPALAGLKADYAGRRSKLDQALLGINQDEMNSAQQLQAAQQKAEAEAAYKEQQLALEREKMRNSQAVAQMRASTKKAPNPAQGYNLTRDPSGGLQFKGPNSRPVTAAQYASVTGTDIRSLLASSGNKKDRGIVQAIDSGMSYDELARRWPEVFGGL